MSSQATLRLQYADPAGNLHDITYPFNTVTPPFPVYWLKGKPVFWDDFRLRRLGYIPQDQLNGQILASPWSGQKFGNPWTWADGNEYSCAITSEAGLWSGRCLKIGGSQWTYANNSGDRGTQDSSVEVAVPSGIIGVEVNVMFGENFPTGTGSNFMLSIEDSDPTTGSSPKKREMQLQVRPRSGAVDIIPGGVTTTILSASVPDDNNNTIPLVLTAPYTGGKGMGESWHRIGFTVNQLTGKFLDFYLNKYYVNLRKFGTNQWILGGAGSGGNSCQDGTYRIEMHARIGTGTVDGPEVYVGSIVVTDENGMIAT